MSETRSDADPHGSAWDTDRELLAINEQFVVEYEAEAAPRLPTYLQRYPKYAEVLTAFVAEYLASSGQVADSGGTPEEAESPRPLCTGTQRGLDAIFGAPEAERRVAERREAYSVEDGEKGVDDKDAGE